VVCDGESGGENWVVRACVCVWQGGEGRYNYSTPDSMWIQGDPLKVNMPTNLGRRAPTDASSTATIAFCMRWV